MDMETYKDIRRQIDVLKDKLRAVGRDGFSNIAKQLFDRNPELQSFGWKRYTPYFNDGDECTFSAYTYDPNINGVGGHDIYSSYTCSHGGIVEGFNEHLVPSKKKVVDFMRMFEDSDLKKIFGDHCEVTVYRGGRVEVNGYDHD